MMNKKKKNVTSALVLGLVSIGVLGLGIKADAVASDKVYTATAVSKSNLLAPNILSSLTKAEASIDVSSGWDVNRYSSDLGISIDRVFAQGQMSLSGMKYATTNFFNIGKSTFKATKTIPMKKGKIYDLDLVYALRAQGKAVGSIDFNGTKITESNGINTVYSERVVAKKDQNYIITMEFVAPKNTGMYLMVGQTATGGIQVTPNVEAPVVNVPEAGTNLVSGTGKAGNTIKVMNHLNEVIGTGEVKSDGSFAVTTDRILKHNDQLTVIQSNGEDDSDPVSTTVKDTIAPDSPVIKDIEFNDQLIKGTGEANSIITVKNAAGVVLGEGTADAKGQIEFKLTQAAVENETVFVTATDNAGNVSNRSKVNVIDTTMPEAPKVEPLNDQQVTLTGDAWKPGSKVEIKVGNQYYYATSGTDNKFNYTFSKPWKAGTVITVMTTDISGNTSPATTITVTSEKKTSAPSVDKVGDTHTKITGTAEANALIEVRVGTDYYKGKAGSDGTFSIDMNQVYPVDTVINVTATGISGKTSDSTQRMVEDTTPPESLVVEAMTDADMEANGMTEAHAKVEAIVTTPNGDNYYFETFADENGKFTIDLDGTFPANSTIVFTATDASGNASVPEEKRIENSIPIGISMDNTITSQDKIVTGETTRPNAIVVIKVNNQIFKGISNDEGQFEINIRKSYSVGTKYEFYTIDGAEKTPVETGIVLPRSITFFGGEALKPTDSILIGDADPFGMVTVTVKDSNGNIISNKTMSADSEGSFTLTLDTPLAAYNIVEATQVVNGYVSELSSTFVGGLRR